MTIAVYQLDPLDLTFPPATHALKHPNGLLALGGDLSSQRLLNAYNEGIFPWYNPGEPILWWSPSPRTVLEFTDFYISKSLAKLLRKQTFTFSINKAFEQVIRQCANTRAQQEGTWITDEINQGYINLHSLGYAHSIEVWQDEELVGGLYGVAIGAVFCGESMFHLAANASKAALAVLVDLLSQYGFDFIDCQLHNNHLESLGASEIHRDEYLARLNTSKVKQIPIQCWLSREYKHTYYG